jgi:predicted kinase
MKKQLLILMQGPSGSGKSTKAKMLSKELGAIICSTDDFMHFEGEYLFQPESLGYFHAYNQFHAESLLQEGKSVIIDNTNLRKDFVKPYLKMAERYEAAVIVHRCDGNFQNVHKVPTETVTRQRNMMESLL